MKIFKRVMLTLLALAIVVAGTWIYIKRDAIFMFGNPIPYMARMVLLNDTTTFLQVNSNPSTYVTKKDNYDTMFKTFTEKHNLSLQSKEGDSYVYTSNTAKFTIKGAVYLRDYMVWTVEVLEKDELSERIFK